MLEPLLEPSIICVYKYIYIYIYAMYMYIYIYAQIYSCLAFQQRPFGTAVSTTLEPYPGLIRDLVRGQVESDI